MLTSPHKQYEYESYHIISYHITPYDKFIQAYSRCDKRRFTPVNQTHRCTDCKSCVQDESFSGDSPFRNLHVDAKTINSSNYFYGDHVLNSLFWRSAGWSSLTIIHLPCSIINQDVFWIVLYTQIFLKICSMVDQQPAWSFKVPLWNPRSQYIALYICFTLTWKFMSSSIKLVDVMQLIS